MSLGSSLLGGLLGDLLGCLLGGLLDGLGGRGLLGDGHGSTRGVVERGERGARARIRLTEARGVWLRVCKSAQM